MNFHPEFNAPIMLLVAVIAFFAGLYINRLPNNHNNHTKIIKALLFAALAVYCYFIIAITVVNRNVTSASRAEWIPFWAWIQIFKGNNATQLLEENILNILLFIPFGCLLSLNWKITVGLAAVIGLGMSLFIEIVQFMTCRGLFQWDDMLHNTIGCIIGALIINIIRGKRQLRYADERKSI